MVLDSNSVTADRSPGDPPLATVAAEVRNLAGRAAAAADELARREAAALCDPGDAPEMAAGLRRAAALLAGLAVIRD